MFIEKSQKNENKQEHKVNEIDQKAHLVSLNPFSGLNTPVFSFHR